MSRRTGEESRRYSSLLLINIVRKSSAFRTPKNALLMSANPLILSNLLSDGIQVFPNMGSAQWLTIGKAHSFRYKKASVWRWLGVAILSDSSG